jgi:excisionase family DNA binding protein
MRQKSGPGKAPAEQVLKDIRRQTRRQYSAEEKIRIVLEGLRGEVTLDEAAAALSVSPSTVRRLIKDAQLSANQLCKGAPWIIHAADLDRNDVKGAATARRLRRPPSSNPLQKTLEL